MELNQMGIFATVVDQGSFTRASERLNMPKSTVSRQVSQLEQQLGARLLNRTTRQLKLTEVGKLYFEHCRRIVEEAAQAEQVVQKMQVEPSGLLRVSMPLAFGTPFMQDIIESFLNTYPKVGLELVLDNRMVDIVEEEIDVAFRAGDMEDSSLIARPIGYGQLVICATPQYLDVHGEPLHPHELDGHEIIRHPSIPLVMHTKSAEAAIPAKSRLLINDMSFIHKMTLRHMGVGIIPTMFALADIQSGTLKQLLPSYGFFKKQFYLVYASRRQQSSKVSAFVNFIMERVGDKAPWGTENLPE